jgi:hypothetical protein
MGQKKKGLLDCLPLMRPGEGVYIHAREICTGMLKQTREGDEAHKTHSKRDVIKQVLRWRVPGAG